MGHYFLGTQYYLDLVSATVFTCHGVRPDHRRLQSHHPVHHYFPACLAGEVERI